MGKMHFTPRDVAGGFHERVIVENPTSKHIDQGGADAIVENMPDAWMDWLTIGGTPEDCIRSIRNLFDAGATSIVLCLMPTSGIDAQIKRFSETVLPNIE